MHTIDKLKFGCRSGGTIDDSEHILIEDVVGKETDDDDLIGSERLDEFVVDGHARVLFEEPLFYRVIEVELRQRGCCQHCDHRQHGKHDPASPDQRDNEPFLPGGHGPILRDTRLRS